MYYMHARKSTGDTMIEVMVALVLFALLSVGVITIMNRGVNMADRSLEIALIREQIDAQADILRYAHHTRSPAWQEIRDNLGDAAAAASDITACPDASQLPTGAFIGNISSSGAVVRTPLRDDTSVYSPAELYSQFAFSGTPSASGIWVVPVAVQGSTDTFDMHIRACWQPPGTTDREVLGTLVRLYDPPAVVVTTPPVVDPPVQPPDPNATCTAVVKTYEIDLPLSYPDAMTATEPVLLKAGCIYRATVVYGDSHSEQLAECARGIQGECQMAYEQDQEQFGIQLRSADNAVQLRIPSSGLFSDVLPSQDRITHSQTVAPLEDVVQLYFMHGPVNPVDPRPWVAGNSVHIYSWRFDPI